MAVYSDGSFKLLKEQVDHPEAEWKEDGVSNKECYKKIGHVGKGNNLFENHVSPDGRFILDCNKGLNLYEFKIEEQGDREKIVLKEHKLQLPIETEGIGHVELAKRVKFESNRVIRILTQDNRDILFELSHDNKAMYLSDVQVEN